MKDTLQKVFKRKSYSTYLNVIASLKSGEIDFLQLVSRFWIMGRINDSSWSNRKRFIRKYR